MARTSENKRHSKYVIRIVCEGDKTEPLFFTDLCDQFYGDSKDFDVRTIPQPNIPVEDAERLVGSEMCIRDRKRILPEEAIKGRNVKSSQVDRKMLLKMKL